MSNAKATFSGPDFTQGVALSAIKAGAMLQGHAYGQRALMAGCGEVVFAVAPPALTGCTCALPDSLILTKAASM